ncbi:MAG: histidine kinase dimerization/phosphoacceptor domain -containing protein [Pseudomonadota bacterium]
MKTLISTLCILVVAGFTVPAVHAEADTSAELERPYEYASGEVDISALAEFLLERRDKPDDDTVALCQRCITEANATGNTVAVAHCNYALGVYHYITENDTAQQEQYYKVALDAYQLAEDQLGQARVLTGLGKVSRERGDYAGGIEIGLEALEHAIAADDSHTIMTAQQNLALTYLPMGDQEKAIEIYAALREEAIAAQDEKFTFMGTVGVAMTYGHMDDLDKAISTYKTAFAGPLDEVPPMQVMQYYADYAGVLMYAGRNQDAYAEFDNAFQVGREADLEDSAAFQLIMAIYGIANLNDGRTDQGRAILTDITAELAGDPSHTRLNSQIYSQWADSEASIGAFEEAYIKLDKSYELMGETYTQSRAAAQTMAEEKFEAAEKARQIERLESEAAIDALRMSQQRNLIWSAAIITGLLSIVAALAIQSYRRQRKMTVQLVTRNSEIERQSKKIVQTLGEKEVLLKEINHRTMNNLQLIASILRTQGRRLSQSVAGQAAGVLRDMQGRIEALAIIQHRLFKAENAPFLPARQFVSELVEQMIRSFGTNVDAAIEVDDINLDVSTTEPLGLIINEMISNAFEHGFGPRSENGARDKLSVILNRRGSELVLTISDNGVGLPDGFDMESTDSLGTSILQALTSQIDGELSVSRLHSGTQWTLVFPSQEFLSARGTSDVITGGDAIPAYS